MTQDLKHIIVYGAFGLLLGAKLVEVLLTRTDTGIIDWWLLLIGVAAAIVHYLPLKAKQPPADEQRTEETLVLRDHSDIERGEVHRHHAATAERGATDSFL